MSTYAYGFPRIGKKREYKKTVENFWAGTISEQDLLSNLDFFQQAIIEKYSSEVDSFPVGEITPYDPMLDTAILVGLYEKGNLSSYYELCRGERALEMKKWFNTNYHYLVPDFSTVTPDQLKLQWNRPAEIFYRFHRGNPYLIGPYTFLKLSSGVGSDRFEDFFRKLSDIYFQICKELPSVHIDEPAFVFETTPQDIKLIKSCYDRINQSGCAIHLFTYYDSIDSISLFYDLPVFSLGLDFVNGRRNLDQILEHGFPSELTLVAGVVNGRNVWKTNISKTMELLNLLSTRTKKIVISNAAPLFHLPVSLDGERLDDSLIRSLSFATERLNELSIINKLFNKEEVSFEPVMFGFSRNEEVRSRIENLKESDFIKKTPYHKRLRIQKERFNLPILPVTTIGSFPQTAGVRLLRADLRSGKIDHNKYNQVIKEKIGETLKIQEQLGLDVLVHGEYERTDMVEFFAERLGGIVTTEAGWVLSYGTRVYRPPIIYGDIYRPHPLTIDEISYAQSLTTKPVKGMLTGPVTILSWSFTREDIPLEQAAYQIALCLQDEIKDYEAAGIGIVQVDEPAFREKAPLKRKDWDSYFNWAIKAFNLATISKPETQIHTHMCYSEFGPVIDKIQALDFDVISIEASRSKINIIKEFENIAFTKQIGLGVWDIHSPVIPSKEQIKSTIENALEAISVEQFWINPDCGLKTRSWQESIESIGNMVSAAVELREQFRTSF
jgi:5-methyltetrahydropteroyltriglutamate--homocysteine methyltransferase